MRNFSWSGVPIGIFGICHGSSLCFKGGSNTSNQLPDGIQSDNSSSGTKKYRGSNNSDGGNTGDGVKIAGEVIGSGDEIGFSKELKELLSDEAGKSRTSEPGFELQGAKMVEMGRFGEEEYPNRGGKLSNNPKEHHQYLQTLNGMIWTWTLMTHGLHTTLNLGEIRSTYGAQDMGKGGSSKGTARQQSTVKPDQVPTRLKEEVSTDRPEEGTDDQTEGRSATPTTQTPTPTNFGDDETIAQVLLNMSQAKVVSREKDKGVELKDVEETERTRPTLTRSLLTLKPIPKIDPKDKGKKKIEEEDDSDTESEAEEVKKLDEEEAIKAALSNEYDFIQARIEADRLLALKLQDEKREQFTVEERAKFLHDTIAAQRRFLAKQRDITIRNRPPTRTQLRNQMMTYLKHVGNKKHSDLKNKTFKEIQALYEKVKRFDESFTAVGSTKDERKIKEMNEGAKDLEHNRLKKKVAKETPKKEDTTKVPAKVDVTDKGTKKRKGGHMKMIARKRKRPQPDVDSDDEHRKCLKIVTFEGTIDSDIMEKKSFIARMNKVSSPDGDYLVIYRANGNFRAFNCLLEVLHIFDRQDLFHLYDLVMEQYSEITLEGIELILWGDLKIMMESSTEENDQKLKDGTVIHMLVERRYPLSKDLLQRMLALGLEVERESTAALDLIRFIKQQIDEK
ncbi:hypothetical protein Tco_0277682 [Tanacetum coccineum]